MMMKLTMTDGIWLVVAVARVCESNESSLTNTTVNSRNEKIGSSRTRS